MAVAILVIMGRETTQKIGKSEIAETEMIQSETTKSWNAQEFKKCEQVNIIVVLKAANGQNARNQKLRKRQ